MKRKQVQPFCAICGEINGLIEVQLIAPASGTALMCEECSAGYQEQFGHRRRREGREVAARPSGVRRGILGD